MTIPTNPGTGGPDLQSVVDGSSEHYQSVIAAASLKYVATPSGLLSPTDIVVNLSASGDGTLLAAQGAGKIIHVLSGVIMAGGAVNITFFSNAAGTSLTGAFPLVANVGFALPFCPVGHFRTLDNQALVLNLSASEQVSGHLVCAVE